MALTARQLGKRFADRPVFRNVSFEVFPGEVVAVVGRNGAGKSTLLRIIAGLTRSTVGNVGWRDEKGEHG